ncbi:MAG: AAA family ATPase [Firmicutes bacterium]|nr:AAA family ATPase [Bacillota bacterium]
MSTSAAKGSRSHFIEKIEAGEVSDVKISGDTTEYYVTTEPGAFGAKGKWYKVTVYYNTQDFYIKGSTTPVGVTAFVGANQYKAEDGTLQAINVVQVDRNSGNIWQFVIYGLLVVIAIIFMIVMFRRMSDVGGGKSAMSFGKSRANMQGNVKVRFSDVAGAEEEKEELKEIVEFLKHPKKYTEVGAKIPRGVLLVGPPGTGKTLFAKAVAGEANVPFFSISGSDFVEMYVGVGASRVRDLFETAKKNMPCIIFIDEIDAVGRQRGAGLDDGIIVMAATNRSDILDPALMRPGRFDRQVYVNPPDVRGREAIFRVHARNKPIASDVDFKVLARITAGFTGADIANVLNEAAIICARDNRTKINMEDIDEAINKVGMGPAKKSRLVTEYDKRITAYHESGHAIVRQLMPCGRSVHLVTIIPRGNAGGFTFYKPDTDSSYISKKQFEADIAATMGGRAAEELVIGDVTYGAMGDIQQATQVARNMVTRYGMSELGPVCYDSSQEVFIGRDYQHTVNYSEETAAKIDEIVRAKLDEGYITAKKLLEENRDKLDVMVRVLTECETIYSEEIELIMQGKSAEEVIAAANAHAEKKAEEKKAE